MNKRAKVTLRYLIAFAIISLILLMYLVLAAHVVRIDDSALIKYTQEDVGTLFNITINNTDAQQDANITQINITIPGSFIFNDQNGTSAANIFFKNSSSNLTWENFTFYAINGSTNKTSFWFNATPQTPGLFNLTITVLNKTGAYLYNISVKVNDTTPASDVSLVPPITTPGNYSQTWIYANVSVTDNGAADTLNITLYNSTRFYNSSSSHAVRWEYNFTSLPNGVYYLNATFNDTGNNINYSTTYAILLDTTGPGTVVLVSPTPSNGSVRLDTSIEVNVTAVDSLVGLETIVVRLYNSSAGVTGPINSSTAYSSPLYANFSGLPEGIYYINATANDTLGNSNTTSFTTKITLDTTAPLVNISLPANTTYSISSVLFNISTSENISRCVLSLNSFANNYTLTRYNDTSYNFTNSSIADGSYLARFWCNDTAGNVNGTETIAFSINAYPDVTLTSPGNNTQSSLNNQTFNCSATSLINLSSIKFYLWNSSGSVLDTNVTAVSGLSNSSNITETLSAEGVYYWNCLVNDTLNNKTWGATNQTIIIDQTKPSQISLISPANAVSSATSAYNFTFNVSDTYDIANCSLIIDGSISENSSSINKASTNGIYKSGLAVSGYTWRIDCTDKAGNINSSGSRTLTVTSSSVASPGGGGSSQTFAITQTQLEQGYTKLFYIAGGMKFTVNNGSHSVTLKKISGKTATIDVSSTTQTAILSEGEIKKFDLNGDGKEDISVKLNSVKTTASADLTVQSIKYITTPPEPGPATTPTTDPTTTPATTPTTTTVKPAKSGLAQWIFALIVIIVIVVVVMLILKANKVNRKKKVFEFSSF